ncbi:MAG TPA: DMT family transporter [Dongiaceae bacterium]|nr:DMT family transporter [Dongiaceae bacterium]
MSPTRRPGLGVAAMVAATLLWGATFVVIRDSVRDIPPLALVAARFGIAAVVYAAVIAIRRRPPDRDAWLGGIAGAPFALACYELQALGLTTTSAGSSAFLTAAGTLSVAFVAWPLLGQRPSPRVVTGILIALAGSALLSWRAGLGFGRGEALTLIGAALWGGNILAIAARIERADPVSLAAVQTFVMALLALPPGAAGLSAFTRVTPAVWLRFSYLALVGSVVAPLLQIVAQRSLPVARIGLLFALEPVFALLFAVSVGAERFSVSWWTGAALILFAVVLVEARSSPPSSPTASP